MRVFSLIGCFALLTVSALAHDIITTNLTFTRDVSRIFARHCIACHGETSSIPLVTYEEARPWAVDIKEQVLGRKMPPWGAVKGFGNLSPDRGLSQEDILILASWVVGGAPKGDPKLLPAQRIPTAAATRPVQDALVVQTRTTLTQPLVVYGIRPLPKSEVVSARLIARWPDGRIEPIVWLYRFDPKFEHTFTFAEPLKLPVGTIVESSQPLRYALETAKGTSPES